jgi:uncharacterized membrane protein
MTSGSAADGARIDRRGLAGRRAAVAAGAAATVLPVVLAAGVAWSVALLLGWDSAATVFLVWVWATISRRDDVQTRSIAAAEDDSRAASEALLLAASVASLVAVAFVLAQAGHAEPTRRGVLTALAVGSALLAWATVHTVYALRYARLYYAPPEGGLAFHGDGCPDYTDFAYVALTIGMTFQVSDTDISKRPIRRAAIHHALLSYLFGAVILGIAVSTVAAILGS